jgi:predicted protein tyrosine phosphatase
MIEVHPFLYIGDLNDYEFNVKHQQGWYVVHACKEPYHRQALGYTGRAVSNTHPEYLIARRGHRLILNMVDADDPDYIPQPAVDVALTFVHEHISAGERVLVHCNQGTSRSAGIGLLYLAAYTDRLPKTSLEEAEAAFRAIYPPYKPAAGVRGFLIRNWSHYCNALRTSA